MRVVSKDGVPWPTAFYYKAVTITPGGFFEFAALHRDHYIGADIATPFGKIPFLRTTNVARAMKPASPPAAAASSCRPTRISTKVTHVKNIWRPTSCRRRKPQLSTQSDSFNFRFRELYVQVDRSERLRRPYHGGSGLFAHRHELARHHGGHIYHASGHRRPVHAWLYLVSSAWYSIEQGHPDSRDFQVAICAPKCRYTSFGHAPDPAGFNNG